ncbi:MAG: hypothetical protein IH606_01835 [Burkholderiales bacterium]|nr:hypothetical protein [Burkholderiales bacterium]
MDRRNFLGRGLGLGLAPLVLAGNAAAAADNSRANLVRRRFFPNVPLLTQDGKKVRFYDDCIRDKTVLINFFLVECTDGLCPNAIANLRKA